MSGIPIASAPPRVISRKAPAASAIDRQLEEIGKKRELLKIELDRMKFEQRDLPPPNSSSKRGHVIRTSPNAFKVHQRRKEIERELMELNQQERLLKLRSR